MMKRIQPVTYLNLLIISLVISNDCWAITVSSSSFLDLTSLTATQISGNASLSFNPDYSSVETDINGSDNFMDGNNPVSLFSDNDVFTESSAFVDQDTVLSQTSVGEPNGLAISTSTHELKYTVIGRGQVELQIRYTLDLFVDKSNNGLMSSFSLAELLDESSGNSNSATLFSEGLPGDSSSINGTLSIILDLEDGQVGFLQFTSVSNSHAQTALVPVPNSLWILTSALGILLRFAKHVS